MRLTTRFQQADPHKGYHFLLSTLIEEGALQCDIITTNIKKIDEAITDCAYIIENAETLKKYETNPETNRKILVDYKVTVFPTQDFQTEQFRSNVHHKNIVEHRTTKEGKAIIKPIRDQYPTRHDFKRFQDDSEQFNKSD